MARRSSLKQCVPCSSTSSTSTSTPRRRSHRGRGALDDGSHTLSRLIGRRTTPLAVAVQRALA